jgi:hypothetical protein
MCEIKPKEENEEEKLFSVLLKKGSAALPDLDTRLVFTGGS